jgi:hypothetical protein
MPPAGADAEDAAAECSVEAEHALEDPVFAEALAVATCTACATNMPNDTKPCRSRRRAPEVRNPKAPVTV